MNITRELLDYIETNSSLTVGTDIFQGKIPNTNLNGIVVTHSGGDESDSLMQKIIVHIASHYDDYDTANDKLQEVYTLLAYCNGLTLASGYVHNVYPLSLVGFVTVTEQNKYIFSCSIVCNITRT